MGIAPCMLVFHVGRVASVMFKACVANLSVCLCVCERFPAINLKPFSLFDLGL